MRRFALDEEARLRDIYIIGGKQLGKTTFLINLAAQDIQKGRGVAFIDAHGDASEDLLRLIPKSRVKDTVYIDPESYIVPIALFQGGDADSRSRAMSDIIYFFGSSGFLVGDAEIPR